MIESNQTRPVSTDRPIGDDLDVVVVGGGQAGLAIGYFLARQGRRFAILEAAGQPAATWRQRWDSLKLFTSARYDALPGLDFPGRSGQVPDPRLGRRLPDRLRQPLRPAGRAGQPRTSDP